jgi:hypothetical protein
VGGGQFWRDRLDGDCVDICARVMSRQPHALVDEAGAVRCLTMHLHSACETVRVQLLRLLQQVCCTTPSAHHAVLDALQHYALVSAILTRVRGGDNGVDCSKN